MDDAEIDRVLAGLMRRILCDEGDEIVYIFLGAAGLTLDGHWSLTDVEQAAARAVSP